MADAQDLKSWGLKKPCGFESHHRHALPVTWPDTSPSPHGERAGVRWRGVSKFFALPAYLSTLKAVPHISPGLDRVSVSCGPTLGKTPPEKFPLSSAPFGGEGKGRGGTNLALSTLNSKLCT